MGEEKRLYPTSWWSRQNCGVSSTTTDLWGYLQRLDELLCDADEVLSGTDIAKTGYSSQMEKICNLTEQVGGFFQYVMLLPYDIDSIIEEPVYSGFNKGATENLSRVHLEDIHTDNTLGIREEWTVSDGAYGSYSGFRPKSYLTIADFMGNTTPGEANPYDGVMSVEYVEEFAILFEDDYNKMKDQFEEGTTLDDYVQYLISMGEFNHKMDQPFLEFLNGLTDLLILPAIYESIVGEEIITGEDLNEFERGMKMVGVIVDAISIGTAIFTGGGSLSLKTALRVMVGELVTDASAYTVGYVGDQLGLPPAITLLLALGAGSFVGTKTGQWAVKGADGKVYALNEIPQDISCYSGDLMSPEDAVRYSEYWRELGIGSDKTWEEFLKNNPNGSIDEYFAIIKTESPWPNEYQPIESTLKPGDVFEMALAPGQPVTLPGRFGTSVNTITDIDYVRNELAVKTDWKPDVDKVVVYKVKDGVIIPILEGPVGPQIDLGRNIYHAGGADQVQILLDRTKNLMDYLEAIDVRSIQ